MHQAWTFLSDHWEGITALGSMVVGACALVFTIYQWRDARRHNRISLRPFINKGNRTETWPDRARMAISLTNNGLGPAVIKTFQIFYKGTTLAEPFAKKLETVMKGVIADGKCSSGALDFRPGHIMPPGSTEELAWVSFSKAEGDDVDRVRRAIDCFDMLLEYESMYGEPTRLDTREPDPSVKNKP